MLSLNKYLKASKLLIVVCLLLFKNILLSQTNLIQNSGFEKHNTPPNWNTTGGGFFDYSFFPEQRIVLNWNVFNSPDYFSTNCPGSYRGIPINTFGTSYPKLGDAHSGIYVFNKGGETKEYISQQLASPLKTDTVYCLSFFTTRADRLPFAIKTLGAYFSVNTPTLITNQYINATPQVSNTSIFLTDTINWVEIQGCFTALGGEQYITIGNFNSNANTDTLRIQSTNPLTGAGTDLAYYYIDSVSLWQNNFPTSINEIKTENEFSISPNPSNSVCTISSKTIIKKVEVTNIAGQVLLSEIINEKTHQLQLQNFSQGIYFIKVFFPNGLSVINKVIVSR